MMTLAESFLRTAEQHPEAPALWIAGREIRYRELADAATALAHALSQSAERSQLCAIFANKTLLAYTAVLATQLCGIAYVPLNPRYPAARTVAMINVCRPAIVIGSGSDLDRLGQVCAQLDHSFEAIIVADADTSHIPEAFFAFASRVLGAAELTASRHNLPLLRNSEDDLAYVMFTSGSTGAPKGVAVRRSGVEAYLSSMSQIITLFPSDRCSGLFDLTFDLSVHDMLLTWSAGACLYVFSDIELMSPINLVREHQITGWFSVPTVAAMAARRGQLPANVMPSLRISAFCGEALPVTLAQTWLEAAPASKLLNLYGPTEATIAVTAYAVDRQGLPSGLATVPIGLPLIGQECLVVDEAMEPVTGSNIGELLIGGSQVSAGYYGDSEATARAFLDLEVTGSRCDRWYRTGDIVRHESGHGLVFVGRNDLQTKVNGYRVELLDVEAALRRASRSELVAALVWSDDATGANSLVGVICGLSMPTSAVIVACAELLPSHMVPRKIVAIEAMPVTTTGKIDRIEVKRIALEQLKKPVSL